MRCPLCPCCLHRYGGCCKALVDCLGCVTGRVMSHFCFAPYLEDQGINEMQTLANAVGSDASALQHTINARGLSVLSGHFERWGAALVDASSLATLHR